MTKPLNKMDMDAIDTLTNDIEALTKRVEAELAATGRLSDDTMNRMNEALEALEKEVKG